MGAGKEQVGKKKRRRREERTCRRMKFMRGFVGRQSGGVSESRWGSGKTNKCHEKRNAKKTNSSKVGQSMIAMARRGEKVARKRAGRQNEYVVVMQEEDDMAGIKRGDGGMPIQEMGY
jgi:hypothetical protein